MTADGLMSRFKSSSDWSALDCSLINPIMFLHGTQGHGSVALHKHYSLLTSN